MSFNLESEYLEDYWVTDNQKKIWKIEIDIFCELQRVCKKHGLKCFVFGGTLLGAVRHKGFIPWDDDFDVAMLREDYEKLHLLSQEFNQPYFLQTTLTDREQYSGIIRIRHSDSTGVIRWDYGSNANNGIYVDIYPLDYIPENKIKLTLQTIRAHFYKTIFFHYVYSGGNDFLKLKDRVISGISKIYFKIFRYEKIYQKYQKCCARYKNNIEQKVGTLCSTPFFEGDRWYVEDLKELVELDFENIKLPCPKGYDRCLTLKYKDYMKLPHIGKRGAFHEGVVYFNPDIPYKNLIMNPFGKEES